MAMSMDEARRLVRSPLWEKVRDTFLRTGSFEVYPKGDLRRLAYVDDDTRRQIDLWLKALDHVDEWRLVVSGERVRELRSQYPGVYPDVLRYAAYFTGHEDRCLRLLKMKFPEVYELCCC